MIDSDSASSGHEPVMRRLARDDESALGELLELHWRSVVAYASRLLRSLDLAQDVAQEAFVRLWDRRAQWDPTGGARPIILPIARNLAIDHRRADRVRAAWTAKGLDDPPTVTSADLFDEANLFSAIEVALEGLGAREREVVVLSRFHGLTRAEIATVTGLAPGTVSNLLSMALTRLARALAPHLDHPVATPPRRMLRGA